MPYRMLVDLVTVVHFLWITFILFGLLPALRYPKIAFIHMAGLLFTLALNVGGWYCPLTYLENYLQGLSRLHFAHGDSFIRDKLWRIVYLELDEDHLRIGAIAWVIFNMAAHGLIFDRKKRTKRA